MTFFLLLLISKLPKHIALAEPVHYLTKSKRFISILNNSGHCISYLDLEVKTSNVCADAEQNLFLRI